ncbi:hypothetical protein GGF39_000304 [Coemansia sp. RSA 1721]|nr:hypothetical protein GGF39_000304 [Coemansia sp. RSA 1721]
MPAMAQNNVSMSPLHRSSSHSQPQHPHPHPHSQQPQQKPNSDAKTTGVDAQTDAKDDKAAPVRKRLSLACTTCRQRKVKCDGGRPSCRTCAKFSWPCVYQPSNRKRGPRPRALALMDGSIPYARSHWHGAHSYYAYAFPGRSPPPPPPPQHLVAPYFGQPHDVPMNGAPVGLDPARVQPGGYNRDTYSSYGDYMSNTGAIRIHHQPPSSMRSPMHAHHGHLPPPHHAQLQPPSGAYARPHAHTHGGPPGFSPYYAQPPTPTHYAHSPTSTHPQAYGVAPATAASEKTVSVVSLTAPAAAAATAASGMRQAELASRAEFEIHAGARTSLGSAAPQPLHPSAQSYESASSYASAMQSQSTAAETHIPAIYARRDADTAVQDAAGFARANPQPPALTPATPVKLFVDPRAPSQPLPEPAHKFAPRPLHDPPMTVPVVSPPVFVHAQHDSRLYSVRSADRPWSPTSASAKPLPFSDGASRPKLPPLSEVFGKDYQSVRSPGGLR